jgi:hypothetical protein
MLRHTNSMLQDGRNDILKLDSCSKASHPALWAGWGTKVIIKTNFLQVFCHLNRPAKRLRNIFSSCGGKVGNKSSAE